jgi:hypothetical protein
MNSMDIQVRVQDRPAHICYELYTELSHFLVVVLDRLQDVQEILRDYCICHPSSLLETVPVLDGHDTRDDGDCNARLSNGLHPTDKDVHVKEHLGEDPRAAKVDFLFEVFQFQLELLWGEEYLFWEAGNSNVEIFAVVSLGVSNEINAMDKATFDRLPDIFPGWRVTSES